MKKENVPYPIVMIYARDWSLYYGPDSIVKDFSVETGHLVGFLISEKKDCYVISSEYFPPEGSLGPRVRYTQAIPKETVINITYLTREE